MHAEKSTNGRSEKQPRTVQAAGVIARLLELLSPRWAASFAASIFFRTQRRAATAAERETLARAARSWLPFEGGRLAVWRWGEGPRVLLAHGWNGRGGQLHALVAPLVASGHEVVTFDGPGHGASPGSSASLPQLARAMIAVASAVGALRAVVTHSMGGPVAALALQWGLEAERVVMVAPPTDPESWLARLAQTLGLRGSARALLRGLVEARAGVPIARIHFARLAPAIEVPLLVVHDGDDSEVPWTEGASIARMTGARLLTTQGLGHRRILGAPEVVSAVTQFVGPAPSPEITLERELWDRRERWAQLEARAVA